VVDFVEPVEVVVVVDGVEGIYEFVQISVGQVDLKGGEDVEVGPGVEVEGDLELLLVDDPVLVEVIDQAVEDLQFVHFEL